MPRAILLLIALMLRLPAGAQTQQEMTHFGHEGVLGTSLDIRLAHAGADPTVIERAVLAEIKRLDGVLSGYSTTSEWSRLRQSQQERPVSTDLRNVLQACDRWYLTSRGAFDPQAASGRKAAAFPRDEAARPWHIDGARGVAHVRAAGRLSLDGLAKGYVIDAAVAAGAKSGPAGMQIVVDIGGDLVVRGPGPHEVHVTDPRAAAQNAAPLRTLRIENAAVATSGGYARSSEDGGSHIIDPETGRSVERVLSATVVAPHCVDADAIATALNVMAPSRGLRWVEEMKDVECLIVDAEGNEFATDGMNAMTVSRPSPTISSTGMVLTLSFNLVRPPKSKRQYRRPYVAAWIERAADSQSVRSLALWIGKRRWLPDLKRWYKIHGRDKDRVRTLTRATRRPGEYELTWDGRDEDGEKMRCGRYVVHLEVAREHGTHQHMTAEIEIGADPAEAVLGPVPNDEVGAARVTVRPRGARARK